MLPFAKKVRSAVRVSATSMPRSPSTRVRRTFVGDSQSTTQLKLIAFSRRPVASTMSSCSRSMRCCVCGADALDRRAAEPAHEVEVVGGEVLDDADVADAVGERADALGGDQEDLAELAVLRRAGAARAAPG